MNLTTTLGLCALLLIGIAAAPTAMADPALAGSDGPKCNAGEAPIDCAIRITVEYCRDMTRNCPL